MDGVVTERHFYCPLRDADVVRLSVFNAHGHEFWTVIAEGGRDYRKRRQEALELITEARDRGLEPGRVIAVEV